MGYQKITSIIYFGVLLITIVLLFNIGSSINNLLNESNISESFINTYGALQKKAGLYGIVTFAILLILSLLMYYFSSKTTYVLLTNIIYIALMLFVFVSANQNYFTMQNINYAEKSEYWITVFMGIFYIIGAVLVSAIGYITVRNYSKRSEHTLNKSNR